MTSKKPAPRGPLMRSKYAPGPRVETCYSLPSVTKQEFKDQTTLSTLVERFHPTEWPTLDPSKAAYGDFSRITSYDEAIDLIDQVDDHFMALDPAVRSAFANDPAKLLDCIDAAESGQEPARQLLQSLFPSMPESTGAQHAPGPSQAVGDPAVGRHARGGEAGQAAAHPQAADPPVRDGETVTTPSTAS